MARPDRPDATEYNTLEDIIAALSSGKFPEMTYVGNQYTKADLIRDLKKVQQSQS